MKQLEDFLLQVWGDLVHRTWKKIVVGLRKPPRVKNLRPKEEGKKRKKKAQGSDLEPSNVAE